jgi:hypothetical protein
MVAKYAAFTDDSYRLSVLLQRLDRGTRAGTRGPYETPWKTHAIELDRQSWLWPRLATDPYLNAQTRYFWMQAGGRPPVPDEIVEMTLARSAAAVRAIRARGGDVIFVRPPSVGILRENEDRRIARQRGWDRLLARTGAAGVYADDDPFMRHLLPAELSHLTRTCATVYTDRYVRRLTQLTTRLVLKPDAPAPLPASDCPPPPIPP